MSTVLFLVFVVLTLLNVAVAFSLGLSSLAALVYHGGYPLSVIDQRIFTAIDSFVLMAIPFYILAGGLMESGGLSLRIVRFANSLVGHIRGGLSMVSVVACMFFAGVSGSAVADTASIGSVLIPAMSRKNYDKGFAAALVASASIVGPIIPPSIPMVIFGVLSGVSIGKLFVAGIIPGLLVGFGLMVLAYYYAVKFNYPREERTTLRQFVSTFFDAFWSLLMPVIILGGILGGIFTATEAGVVAVVYAFAVGMFIYRELKWQDLPRILYGVVCSTSVVMLLVGMSSLFGWILTSERIPQLLASFFLELTTNKILLLMIINILMLIAGTFLDVAPALILMVPILLPLVQTMGLDMIHFGMIVVLNLVIGLITPPVAPTLVIASNIAKISLDRITAVSWPFFMALVAILLLITYLPALSTFLPNLLFR